MKQRIEFTNGETVDTGMTSLCLENVPIYSVKPLLSSIIEKIDDMYADFIVNGNSACECPDRLRQNIIASINRLRMEQKSTQQEQG